MVLMASPMDEVADGVRACSASSLILHLTDVVVAL
jgi:hypothetical protein